MKGYIMTIIGIVGSFIASLFGGWDAGLATLLIFMGIDYVSGLVVAGVFHKSNKTESGALESKAGWKGLCRKCMTLLFVLIAYRLDLAIPRVLHQHLSDCSPAVRLCVFPLFTGCASSNFDYPEFFCKPASAEIDREAALPTQGTPPHRYGELYRHHP